MASATSDDNDDDDSSDDADAATAGGQPPRRLSNDLLASFDVVDKMEVPSEHDAYAAGPFIGVDTSARRSKPSKSSKEGKKKKKRRKLTLDPSSPIKVVMGMLLLLRPSGCMARPLLNCAPCPLRICDTNSGIYTQLLTSSTLPLTALRSLPLTCEQLELCCSSNCLDDLSSSLRS